MELVPALCLIAEVLSKIFPWKEISTSYQRYLFYKLEIKKIDSELEPYRLRIKAFEKFADLQKEMILKKLEEQRKFYESRLPLLKRTLENSFLSQEELRKVMIELRKKIQSSRGEELKSVNSAIIIISQQLSNESINSFNLLSKEVDLQIAQLTSSEIKRIETHFPKQLESYNDI